MTLGKVNENVQKKQVASVKLNFRRNEIRIIFERRQQQIDERFPFSPEEARKFR